MITRSFLLDALAAMIAGGGVMDPANLKIALIKSFSGSPGPASTFDQITEPIYDGYVAQAHPGWESVALSSGRPYVNASDTNEFRPTGSVQADTAIGVAVYDDSGTAPALLRMYFWDAPISLASPDDAVTILDHFELDPAANYGNVVVVN